MSGLEFSVRESWEKVLQEEFEKDYFESLQSFLDDEYRNEVIYPPRDLVFNAFNHCDFDDLKVVILGQDPYHGPGQANGLSFSVCDGVKFPPSLRNIFKEVNEDVLAPIPLMGSLERWADQGVLLLNTVMTVRASKPASHKGKGWEQFTDAVIQKISSESENVVFMLWGKPAQSKASMIDNKKHMILEAVHPSPLSAYRGFFGCKHFSKANDYLKSKGIKEVEW
ncbi:uracil-DNA glycosylase [Aureibacter tunicatorum]|uniref:Uracil-DNA glycosylase n=1 Tax=Aureibacter tunicatorum TaxID=866807 RepID=A0AAE4BSB3_9BACT|nr:uracil-DNA glycosylase [Aureibacter tunicatorum]MDR6241059.1 uracil-DNA glycosylase [Aureibacter tunicatorum]BDD03837.1 uracil-DNA glycosylase 2 [Aureibacter tunicatorum]